MNNKGLTFVEIVLSTILIILMIATMFAAFVGAHYLVNRARHRMQAFYFAREAQDKLRSNYSYTDSEMDVGSHDESEIGDNIIRGEMKDLAGLKTTLTYDVGTGQPDGYKEVVVHVTWEEIRSTLEMLGLIPE